MAESNKSYRIRTKVGHNADTFLDVQLDQDYESLEILSLRISDKDVYRLHNSDYGVIVGRVLANGNFGVPNAKISVFIPADSQNSNLERWNLYPYTSTSTKNNGNIRYNLLPDESVKDCHKAVGTFPHKTYLLENESLLEVFDDYYIYTTRTNAAGDYLICGVPTGMQTLHMDLDLSDCGILSQRPRDFVYKGYTIEQFENPNQFKKDENIDGLSQIFSQDQPVYVQPFWGNEDNGEEIGITRADIEIAFKFEPTCVFMGSAVSDSQSNGVGKKCVPTNKMGSMDELIAGEGTIEMIRKTPGGNVEEFSIKGNHVIDGNGIWCYQIPMNLDYMMTDEYGNMVPTDDPEKGIPTRTRVRFRASLTDMADNSQSFYRAKYLIPNNPRIDDDNVDYNFGTYTDEDSYRDLFWNGVYTVKSYIPRFQKSKRWKSERFSGIKSCNYYGTNNPMPYNNLRIKLPLVFTVLCVFVKLFIKIVTLVNRMEGRMARLFSILGGEGKDADKVREYNVSCVFIGDGLCPDMEGWYFAPGCGNGAKNEVKEALMDNTLEAAGGTGKVKSTDFTDETSLDFQNTTESEANSVCLTTNIDFLLNCFELALADEFRVINFDFYNDWVNGVLYFPRWMRKIKRKKRYRLSLKDGVSTYYKDKVQGCMNAENSTVKKTRYYTQQCSMAYGQNGYNSPYNIISSEPTCYDKRKSGLLNRLFSKLQPSKCHKQNGMTQFGIFGKKSGLVTEETTMLGQYVYYLKPCEWKETENGGKKRVLLFATDLVLLGTLNDCDENGIPQAFKYLNNSSYIMPTNLALTTLDDEAYIYTSDNGTVCSSSKTTGRNSEKNVNNVYRVSPDYKSTASAYSNTDGEEIKYSENDDPIPVTETAGISWNYSGPGQDDENLGEPLSPDNFLSRALGKGNKRLKYLYYPGGHFLGLSCINSETNIKSCVNLKRICELGASMSQRREEIRSYGQDGKPRYRYYVPTGLISNVDIESASFRSMFATINHNRLIADRTSEETGYKAYTFRFLRPDGFDGALSKRVHIPSSPYNQKVNHGTVTAITDSSSFFMGRGNVSNKWSYPDDYDRNEVEYTERRTVEDTINDYYMFRFGLDSFSDKEQKSHFLDQNTYGQVMPQYENSFYFYFGLKDGATALDEFKKQFFSTCEANVVLKEPYLTIVEEVNDDLSNPEATVGIVNMVGPYTINLSDNTNNLSGLIMGYEYDTFDLETMLVRALGAGYSVTLGNEYTITVTDSVERMVTKTFVFGSSMVKMDAEAINFRFKVNDGQTIIPDPKKGGFLKVNDAITILDEKYSLTECTPADSESRIQFGIRESGSTGAITYLTEYSESPYVNENGEAWHLFPFSKTGTFNIYIKFKDGNFVSVYTVTIVDNTDVEIYVSCNYLGYKSGYGLSALTDSQLENSSQIFGPATPNGWIMRHSFYRQTQDDTAGYNHYIYSSGKNTIAIFGWPENIDGLDVYPVPDDVLLRKTYSQKDYDQYEGYSLDDKNSYIPTKYWNGIERKMFEAMAYSDDGRAAADASDITITNYEYTDGVIRLAYNGTHTGITEGHGCVVVLENGTALSPVISGGTMVVYSDTDIYQKDPDADQTEWDIQIKKLLSMATVYPTMRVPSFYKPFYGEMDVAVWNYEYLEYSDGTSGERGRSILTKEPLPLSFTVSGSVYNGLTYPIGAQPTTGRFFSGDTDGEYDTYFIYRDKSDFWTALTTDTSNDYMPNRNLSFSLIQETTAKSENDEEVYDIEYQIVENVPPTASTPNVLTERYASGFDKVYLSDSCSISDCFYDTLKLSVKHSDSGTTGDCTLYTGRSSLIEGTSLYVVKTELFECPTYGANAFTPLINTTNGSQTTGYYNHNADPAVRGYGVIGNVTNNQGGVYRVTFPVSDTGTAGYHNVTCNVGEAESNGFTIYRKVGIKVSIRSNLIRTVKDAIERGDTIMPLERESDKNFKPCDYNAIVQVYERPDDGTKNKMKVYHLTPIVNMDVIFPGGTHYSRV